MGRPQKTGLEFYYRKIDFSGSPPVVTIRVKYGNDGVQVYECILDMIYRNGYYLEYDEDAICAIANIVQVKLNTVRQVVAHLCGRSLLVKITSKLTPSVTVLTSADIQRTYQRAVSGKASKTPVTVDREFWLLDENETRSFIKVFPVSDSSEKNPDSSKKNPSSSEKKCTNKNKIKRFIEIDRRACAYLSNEEVNALFVEYLEEMMSDGTGLSERQVNSLIRKLMGISEDPEVQKAVIREATIHHWKSFYPLKDDKGGKGSGRKGGDKKWKPRGSFYHFEQRQYDSSLEDMLLENSAGRYEEDGQKE